MSKRIAYIFPAFVFICLAAPLNTQAQNCTFEIKGQVLDAETDRPLHGVNVFIDQTMQGVSTNENGGFKLTNIRPGYYTLIFSMVGYEMFQMKVSVPEIASKTILAGLTSSVLDLPDLVVEAERPRKWQKNLEQFENAFLGYTENASKTKITNPEILEFKEERRKLISTTHHNPLVLINRALGYKIKYHLHRIEIENNALNVHGFAQFDELVPESVDEYDQWQEQRRKAYIGSFRHFIQALATGELEKEGFIAFYSNSRSDLFDRYKIETLLKDNRARNKIHNSAEIAKKSSTLPNHIVLVNPKSEFIGVIYSKEPVEQDIKRLMKTDQNLQVSLIELPADTVLIDVSSGNYRPPYRPVLHGYWAVSSRLPDLLPDVFDTSIFMADTQPFTQTDQIEFSGPDSLLLENSWKKGQQLIENNNFEQALKNWETIYDLHNAGPIQETDPRIGFRYIEIVTVLKLRNRYKKASELYNWGLSNISHSKYKKAMSQEIERLEPISTILEQEMWHKLLNENQLKELGKTIKEFWEVKDPAPSTLINERLLEHWERLAYAKKSFTRGSSWVYGTDDRAKIYVKYGMPDNAKNIDTQSETKISETVGYQAETNVNHQSQSSDGSNIMPAKDPAHALNVSIRQLNLNPGLQVWIYKNSTYSTQDDFIYLFGNDGNTGEFRELTAVEDVIPSKAFRRDHFGSIIPPAIILQQSFYRNLAKYHPLFNQIHLEIQRLVEESDIPSHNLAKMFRSQNESNFSQLRYRAPIDKSDYASNLYEIPVVAHQYRLLDEKNEPVLVTFIESKPHQSLFIDQAREKTFDYSEYQLDYSVKIVDTNEGIIFEDSNKKNINQEYGNVNDMESSISYFEVPNPGAGLNQLFFTELHNQEKSTTELSDSVFPEYIRGLGRHSVRQPEPLSTDKTQMEVSDFILGYRDELSNESSPFGFKPAHDGKIPQGNEIIVHFEIYHLNASANDPGQFDIDYQLKDKEGLLAKIFGDGKQTESLTLSYESMEPNYRDNLEIDTSELETGDYTLSFVITDLKTGQAKHKNIDLTVVE